MNTKKTKADAIKTLLQRLKERTQDFYNFHYKQISNDNNNNCYIAVLNRFNDVAAVLVYRLDIKYLTRCVSIYDSRVSSDFLNMCEHVLNTDNWKNE